MDNSQNIAIEKVFKFETTPHDNNDNLKNHELQSKYINNIATYINIQTFCNSLNIQSLCIY